MPEEVYDFMNLFPHPTRTRPAVEYVPMPYRAREGRAPSDR
jgi:Serine dehydrogenase proteinase